MKVTVVVNDAGEVIAAHVPLDAERLSDSEQGAAPMVEVVARGGQKVLDLDLPADDVPSIPPPDFLERIQRVKDEANPSG
jgi:hypothetical protein